MESIDILGPTLILSSRQLIACRTLKSLIVNGSPRERIHTSMIEALEMGLIKAGSEITRRRVYALDIKPCLGCFTCWRGTPGICTQEDDMGALLPLVAQSDLLLLVTPVYLDGMTGPMKIFIDRLLPLLEGRVEMRGGRLRHPLREGVKRGKIALMSHSGFPELDTFEPLVAHVKAICENLDREYAGEVLVPSGWHLRRRGAWDEILGLIASAGEYLVNEGKFPADISSNIHSMVLRDEVARAVNAIYG